MGSWPGYTPSADPLHQVATRHARTYRYVCYVLWGLACLGALGDVVTTWVGVTPLLGGPYDALDEAIGVTEWVLDIGGPWALLPQKALGLSLAWRVSQAFPRPYPLGIVLTVAVINVVATLNNLYALRAIGAIAIV